MTQSNLLNLNEIMKFEECDVNNKRKQSQEYNIKVSAICLNC